MTQNQTAVTQLSTGASGVEITSSAYYADPEFDSDGVIIWVAEVRNNTSRTVQNVDIEFTSHDASGQVLASDFTFVGPIQPGETRANEGLASLQGTEASVDIQVSDVQFATEDPHLSSAQITSSNWRVDTETGLTGAVDWTWSVWSLSVLSPTFARSPRAPALAPSGTSNLLSFFTPPELMFASSSPSVTCPAQRSPSNALPIEPSSAASRTEW